MKDARTPFFARFLENQDYPDVATDVKAGPGGGGGGGGGGGHGGGGGTTPDMDQIVTQKYPSDDDEGGVEI